MIALKFFKPFLDNKMSVFEEYGAGALNASPDIQLGSVVQNWTQDI